MFFTVNVCLLSLHLTGVTLVVTDFCLFMAFCAHAFRISVFDFLRRLPAIKGGTNFLFLLGCMTLVVFLLSKKPYTADSLTIVFWAVSTSSEACAAVMFPRLFRNIPADHLRYWLVAVHLTTSSW